MKAAQTISSGGTSVALLFLVVT